MKICYKDGCESETRTTKAGKCETHRGVCSYRDCNRKTVNPSVNQYNNDQRYCGSHGRRLRSGNLDEPINGGGTRYTTHNGYIGYYDKERGSVLEHRIVMESVLGRRLLPGENVHHKDTDKTNNHPDNLELWVTGQPTGGRVEDMLKWAHLLIDRYENGTVD